MAQGLRQVHYSNPNGLQPAGEDAAGPTLNEFQKGVQRAGNGLQADLYGAASLAGSMIGNEQLQQFGDQGYDRNNQEAAAPELAGRVESIYDVNNLTDVMDWALGGLGSLVPTAATMLAGGVMGGAIGRGFAQTNRSRGLAIGAGVGATIPNAGMQAGGIFKEIEQESGIEAPGTALGAGIAAGGIDLLSPLSLLRKTGGRTRLSNIGQKAALTSAVEGGTEVIQESIALGARDFADPNYDALAPENRDANTRRLVEAGALGALGGGVMGGAGGAFSRRSTEAPSENPFVVTPDEYNRESPAASLTPDDAKSDINVELSQAIEDYSQGFITRGDLDQSIVEVSSKYTGEVEPHVYDDLFRRIKAATAVRTSPKPSKQDPNEAELDDSVAESEEYVGGFGEELKSAYAKDEQRVKDIDLQDEVVDEAAVADAMNINFAVPEVTTHEAKNVLSSVGLPIKDQKSLTTAISTARKQNPDIDYNVLNGLEATTLELQAQGFSGEQLQGKIQSIAASFAKQSRVETADPVAWLQSTYMLRSAGKIPAAMTPIQQDDLTGEDLRATPDPRKLRAKRRTSFAITDLGNEKKAAADEVAAKDSLAGFLNAAYSSAGENQGDIVKQLDQLKNEVGALKLKDYSTKTLEQRSREIDASLDKEAILKPATTDTANSRSVHVQDKDGSTLNLYLPALVRRMMQNESSFDSKNIYDKTKVSLLTGLSTLLNQGYKIPSISPTTVVHHRGKGVNITYAELFESDGYTQALVKLQFAEEKAIEAREALDKALGMELGKRPSSKVMDRLITQNETAVAGVKSAKSQAAIANADTGSLLVDQEKRIAATAKAAKERAARPKKSKEEIRVASQRKAIDTPLRNKPDGIQGEGLEHNNQDVKIKSRNPIVINGYSVPPTQAEDMANVFEHEETDPIYSASAVAIANIKKELSDIRKMSASEVLTKYKQSATDLIDLRRASIDILEDVPDPFKQNKASKRLFQLLDLRKKMLAVPAGFAADAVAMFKKVHGNTGPISRKDAMAKIEASLEQVSPKHKRELRFLKAKIRKLEEKNEALPANKNAQRYTEIKALTTKVQTLENLQNKFTKAYNKPLFNAVDKGTTNVVKNKEQLEQLNAAADASREATRLVSTRGKLDLSPESVAARRKATPPQTPAQQLKAEQTERSVAKGNAPKTLSAKDKAYNERLKAQGETAAASKAANLAKARKVEDDVQPEEALDRYKVNSMFKAKVAALVKAGDDGGLVRLVKTQTARAAKAKGTGLFKIIESERAHAAAALAAMEAPARAGYTSKESPAQSASIEAVKAIASNTIEQLKNLNTKAKINKLQTALTTLAKNLNLDTVVEAMSVEQAMAYAKQNGFTDYLAKMQNGTLHGFVTSVTNGKIRVFIHPGLTGKLRNEIIAHEFGHVVFRSLALSASKLDATAIMNDFKAWSAKHGRSTAGALLRSKKTAHASLLAAVNGLDGLNVADLPEASRKYLLDFEEYFADNVSKWVMDKTATPRTEVEKFFHAAVQMFKKLAARLGVPGFNIYGMTESLVSSTADFTSVFSEKLQGLEAALKNMDADTVFEVTKENAFALYAAARANIERKLGELSRHGIGSSLQYVNKKTRAAIDQAMNSPAIKNQVSKLGDVTPELAFQMWQAGKLKVGPTLQASFESLQKGFESILDAAHKAMMDGKHGAALKQNKERDNLKSFEVVDSILREKFNRETPAMSSLEFEGVDAAIAKQERAAQGILGKAKRAFFISDERLRATKIPTLNAIADMLHVKAGRRNVANTMDQDKAMKRGGFDAQVRRIFNNKDQAHGAAVLKVLHNPDTLSNAPADIQRTAKRVFQIMREVRDYMVGKGVELGDRGEQYFPWVFDIDKMDGANAAELRTVILQPKFAAALKKELDIVNKARSERIFAKYPDVKSVKPLTPEKFADQIVEGIVANDGYADTPAFGGNIENDPNPVDATPVNRFMNRRLIDFIRTEGSTKDKAFVASLMSDDLGLVLNSYIGLAVKKAEYTTRFGNENNDAQWLPAMLAKAKKEGATEADIELATDYVNATMGVHGRKTALWLSNKTGLALPAAGKAINTNLQKGMGTMMVYQNVRLLVGATFSSLIDPMGIAVRSGDLGLAWQGFKSGIKSMISAEPTMIHEIAESLGIIDYNVVNEALGWEYGGVYLGGTARKINEGFFKLTGLQAWTRMTRVMATSSALKFLARHKNNPNKHSARYFEELNVAPADIKLAKDGSLQLLTRGERKKASYEEMQRDDRVRSAIVRFVDESILRPNPSQRPLWASDPHWMLAFHLKSFMYSFHDRILKRAWHEAKNGNTASVANLMMIVPVMVAADFLKDMVMNGGEEDARKANWGVYDYTVNGIFRAGLPGVPGMTAYDMYKDYQYGSIPGKSLLGPTIEQFLDPDFNKAMPVQQIMPDL